MKKLKMLSLVFAVVLMTGCGSEAKEFTKTCTLTSNDTANGYKLEAEYKIYGKGKVAERVETVETVTSDDKDTLEYFEEYLKETYDKMNKEYGGYDVSVTNKDGKVISKTKIDYNKMNMEQYVKDNSAMKEYVNSDNKIYTEGLISTYEAMGATCK